MEYSSVIHSLMAQIRDLINASWKHFELRQNGALFSQLISALDTVEDTEEAIQSFSKDPFPDKTGERYLVTYGVLQAFFLQQDAVFHLCEALDIKDNLSNYPSLVDIRDIRNDSIGHPTKKDRPKSQPTSYHQISRPTMEKDGFTLLSNYNDGTSQFRDISLTSLISTQNRYVVEILTQVLASLVAEDKAHREKFRMVKLAFNFPQNLGYAFEKASMGISELKGIALWGIEEIQQTFHSFHEAIGERDMEAFNALQDEIDHIDHSVERLRAILNLNEAGTIQPGDELDYDIYMNNLRTKAHELEEYAAEIDSEYNKGEDNS